ncbi:MAG: hypothetical protein K8R46_02620 [Pirellulales bacterium]|nr:hypothetical protein [Pirellulales bacterium]
MGKQTILSRAGAFLRLTAARVWLVFCSLSFLFALLFLLISGCNPLRSDDPYLVGFLFGGIGICLALVYSSAELIKKDGYFKDVIWLVACGLWCAFLCLEWHCASSVGQEIMLYSLLIGSLITAAVEWPLLRFGVPHTFYAITSIAGATLIVLFLFVVVQGLTR